VRVYAVSKGSPADTKLQIGDVITGIDGTPVGSLEAMRQIMSTVRAGVPLTLAIRRGEKPLEVQVAPAPSNTNPNGVVLGISLEDLWTYDIPVSVKVGAANVVGPSWSGVLTLEIIDQLTPGGVLHGNTVAGTGSVEPDGSVSKIGGLRQKMNVARRLGVDVIFVPKDQAGEAQTYAGAVPVVGVAKVADMVAWLQAHPK
jgi:PDZ domain-containing protein